MELTEYTMDSLKIHLADRAQHEINNGEISLSMTVSTEASKDSVLDPVLPYLHNSKIRGFPHLIQGGKDPISWI